MKKKIFFTVAAFLLVTLFFAPTIAKNYIVKNSKELLGRQISLDKIKYNYFTSTLQIIKFKMLESNAKDNFIELDTLLLNLEPLKLINNKTSIEEFYINGLNVNTSLKDSIFNFNDLIEFYTSEEVTEDSEEEEEETPFQYEISNINLKNLNLSFNNKNVKSKTSIDNFSCEIPFIGWNQEEKSNADVKFKLEDGGTFQSSLNINPVNGEFDSNIILTDLQLSPFFNYIKEYALINSMSGSLNTNINISGNTKEIEKSVLNGTVDVYNFKMTDNKDKEFLKTKHLNSMLKNIDYANETYTIENITFNQPYVYFSLDSITNNLSTIFKLDEVTETSELQSTQIKEEEKNTESSLKYKINNFVVKEGIVDYNDNLTGEDFNYHLSKIKINTQNIVSDAKWIDLYSDMLLNNRGKLDAKLSFNPNDYKNLDLDLTIEDFLLSDINIYSKYYMGHNIVNGDFYYFSKSKITDGKIKSENKLLVKNVAVSNEKGGLYNLPLKFALFLLKDKNGDVNLDVPVRGDLNDPKVSVGKIIWNTFKNLIVKTAASSVNLLAGLVGANPKEFEEIKFKYVESTLSQKHSNKLDKLIEMENKKKGLKIKLTHFVDPKLQREAFAKAQLGKEFFFDKSKDYLEEEEKFEKYIYKKVGNDTISIKDAINKLTDYSVIDSLIINSNRLLIKNTYDYLKTKSDSTNISVLNSNKQDPKNTGSVSRFKIDYEMLEEN